MNFYQDENNIFGKNDLNFFDMDFDFLPKLTEQAPADYSLDALTKNKSIIPFQPLEEPAELVIATKSEE